jgi:hypothetical protein
MLFLLASSVSALCLIPTWFDPKVTFGDMPTIETNQNFTIPVSFTFDAHALKVKIRTYFFVTTSSADRVSLMITLLNEDGKVVRPVYHSAGDSANGPWNQGLDKFVISSLGVPAGQYKYNVTINNYDRVIPSCRKRSAISPLFTINNPPAGAKQQVTDAKFIAYGQTSENPKTVVYQNSFCTVMAASLGRGGFSSRLC